MKPNKEPKRSDRRTPSRIDRYSSDCILLRKYGIEVHNCGDPSHKLRKPSHNEDSFWVEEGGTMFNPSCYWKLPVEIEKAAGYKGGSRYRSWKSLQRRKGRYSQRTQIGEELKQE